LVVKGPVVATGNDPKESTAVSAGPDIHGLPVPECDDARESLRSEIVGPFFDRDDDRPGAGVREPLLQLFLVSNEVGMGIVPDNALARAFRDWTGRAHQSLAQAAGVVYFCVAGLPMKLKG